MFGVLLSLAMTSLAQRNAVDFDTKWSQSIAVGGEAFVNQVVETLGPKVGERETAAVGDSLVVREPSVSYSAHFDSKMGLLRPQNALLWELSLRCVRTYSGPTPGSHGLDFL